MQLLVNNQERADANLCIRWCLSPEDRRSIEENRILNAHLLITVASMTEPYGYRQQREGKKRRRKSKTENQPEEQIIYSFEEVDRDCVPLTQGVFYQIFSRPGKYRIFATIVGDETGNIETLRATYFGSRKRTLVHRNGDFDPKYPFMGTTALDVNVGDEFFAPPPPAWERAYFDLWPPFRETADDQCHWRRRRLFAYTLMPIFLLVWWFARIGSGLLTYLFLFFHGRRGLRFRPVYKIEQRFSNIYSGRSFRDSVFLTDMQGKDRMWFIVFHPWLVGGIMLVVRASFGRWASWSQFLHRFFWVYVSACVIALAVNLILMAVSKIAEVVEVPKPNKEEVLF